MIGIALGALAVLFVVIGIVASIALHEAGHLAPAKLFGVKVTQYMIGFGGTMFSCRRGETEYGLKWLPLGGYVRMIGMFPPRDGEDDRHLRDSSTGAYQTMAEDARRAPAEVIAPGDEDRTFYKLSVPKKIVVMLGGPMMNLLLATALLGGVAMAHSDPTTRGQPTTTLAVVQECVRTDPARTGACQDDEPQTPANAAGLRPGDEIVEFAGKPITEWDDIRDAIRPRADQSSEVVVRRDGQLRTFQITPMLNEVAKYDDSGEPVRDAADEIVTIQAGFIGVEPIVARTPVSITGVPGVVWRVFTATGDLVLNLPERMVDIGEAAFGSAQRDPEGPVGLVGVGRLAGEIGAHEEIAGADKAVALVGMLGSLNMALFVFNLLPLLPLDGGHVAGALWEGFRRQVARARRAPDPGPVDVSKALPLIYVAATILIAMSLLLLYADIVKPITLQ